MEPEPPKSTISLSTICFSFFHQHLLSLFFLALVFSWNFNCYFNFLNTSWPTPKNLRGRAENGSKNNQSGCDEESGWTSYLEDFSKGIEPSYCSSLDGSSMVSDAASSAAWKFSHHNHLLSNYPSFKAPNLPKKLSFKKARAKQISEDDPLEDTASSPVNSPKVRDLINSAEISSRKVDDQLEGSISMGKGLTSSEYYSDLKTDDDNKHDELKFNGENIDCTDLKKRGLCLVPMSLLVNYLG